MDSRKRVILKKVHRNAVALLSFGMVTCPAAGSMKPGSGMAAENSLIGFTSYLGPERVRLHIDRTRHV
jgi:hypothetical protein